MKIAVASWGHCLTLRTDDFSQQLIEAFEKADFHVLPLGDPDIDHQVMFEYNQSTFDRYFANVSQPKSLVIFEPKSVNPSNYSKRMRKVFSHIWAPTELMVETRNERVYGGGGFYVPAKDLVANAATRSAQKYDVAVVNENKFSLFRNSLYSLRSSALKFLIREGFTVALGGKNWDKGIFWHLAKQTWHYVDCLRSGLRTDLRLLRLPLNSRYLNDYLGRVDSVVSVYSRCRFALVVENEAVYVTEKLFNALAAGTIPVYVGPKLSTFGIPDGIAIEAKADIRDIAEAIKNFDESCRDEMIARGRTFLLSKETEAKWLQVNIMTRLIDDMRSTLNNLASDR
jgi:Glycosyltransferase family 10 (fucosyltransferase) C-term